jgi:TfoX/Sxy family transcriptional regulator of competence genes
MTKTTKETIERITKLLQHAGTIRTRNMMGGYLVYCDEVLVGQINENALYIKAVGQGEEYEAQLSKAEPYPGAKLAYKIPEDILIDPNWVTKFLEVTKSNLTRA